MSVQGSLLNQSFNEEAEMKLMTVLRCLEELIMSIENLLNQGMLLPLVKLIYQSLVNYINNVLLIINIQLTEAQLIDLCQVQVTSVVNIFRQSLDFMIGGRYQLLQLYHQAAATNLS
uniref:Uncharacterized protein n=2 Tax=Amphimedon queenslandica TaxID=400682 RepID=A0A1X7SV22_AMPQE